MSLTISGLASVDGDPLTYGGTPEKNDANTTTNETGGAGTEIADIVLGTFSIVRGQAGGNSGHLIVGTATEGSGDAVGTFTYSEIAPDTTTVAGSTRLRYSAVGTPDNLSPPAGSTAKALFVGQGVDGPLGVIGAYTIAAGTSVTAGNVDSTTSTSIGRLAADGQSSVDVGSTIYGAFGAQVP